MTDEICCKNCGNKEVELVSESELNTLYFCPKCKRNFFVPGERTMNDDMHYKLFRREFLKKHPEAEENLIRGFYRKFKKESAAE